MTALTLFQIAAEFRQITDVLQDVQCDEQTLADTLEGERWPLEVKAQNYGFVIRNLEANAEAIDGAIVQMEARAQALKKRADALRERLKQGMEIAGVSELSCPYFAMKLKKNPPAVDVFDEKQVPESYWVQPPPPAKRIDKKAIKTAIDAGREVPGAKINQAIRLEIK
jgi:hypothetical protein